MGPPPPREEGSTAHHQYPTILKRFATEEAVPPATNPRKPPGPSRQPAISSNCHQQRATAAVCTMRTPAVQPTASSQCSTSAPVPAQAAFGRSQQQQQHHRRAAQLCRAEGLSYKDAGVDIDAGNELVKRIQKMNPSIGGFSGMMPFGERVQAVAAAAGQTGAVALLCRQQAISPPSGCRCSRSSCSNNAWSLTGAASCCRRLLPGGRHRRRGHQAQARL